VDVYLFLDEQNNWCLSTTREPISRVPLERVKPIARLKGLENEDIRGIIDPTQHFLKAYQWELSDANGNFNADDKLLCNLAVDDERAPVRSLFMTSAASIQNAYRIVKEMLGFAWVSYDSARNYKVNTNLKARDSWLQANQGPSFKRTGKFQAAKGYLFFSGNNLDLGKKEADDAELFTMICWEPTSVSLLFWFFFIVCHCIMIANNMLRRHV